MRSLPLECKTTLNCARPLELCACCWNFPPQALKYKFPKSQWVHEITQSREKYTSLLFSYVPNTVKMEYWILIVFFEGYPLAMSPYSLVAMELGGRGSYDCSSLKCKPCKGCLYILSSDGSQASGTVSGTQQVFHEYLLNPSGGNVSETM